MNRFFSLKIDSFGRSQASSVWCDGVENDTEGAQPSVRYANSFPSKSGRAKKLEGGRPGWIVYSKLLSSFFVIGSTINHLRSGRKTRSASAANHFFRGIAKKKRVEEKQGCKQKKRRASIVEEISFLFGARYGTRARLRTARSISMARPSNSYSFFFSLMRREDGRANEPERTRRECIIF